VPKSAAQFVSRALASALALSLRLAASFPLASDELPLPFFLALPLPLPLAPSCVVRRQTGRLADWQTGPLANSRPVGLAGPNANQLTSRAHNTPHKARKSSKAALQPPNSCAHLLEGCWGGWKKQTAAKGAPEKERPKL